MPRTGDADPTRDTLIPTLIAGRIPSLNRDSDEFIAGGILCFFSGLRGEISTQGGNNEVTALQRSWAARKK
jgi:hypothetical protein